MSKFFKRIAKESVKFTAEFVVSNLTVMAEEDCYVRLQIQRGDQKPNSLAPLFIRGSGMTSAVQRVQFPANRTQLSCKFYIKNGEPEAKTATIQVYLCDAKGKGTFLGAQGEINLARHFGDQFKSGS